MTSLQRAFIAVAIAFLFLAGCGRHGAESRPPADGYYRLPLTDNPVTLDPALFTDVNSEGVARRIFNNLVKLDSKLQPVPDLAKSWKISDDGLTYTFALRKGVRFHNGREMVADDVRFSFERLLRAETASQRAWVVEPIAGARELRDGKALSLAGLETPDACTIVLRLKEALNPALMLNLLAMGNAAIVPREEVAERGGGKFGRRPVGTGPFRFVSWRDHDAIVLARNDQYFGGPAKLAGLRFRIIKESLVAWQEYLAGGLEHCAVPEGFLKEAQSGPQRAELRSTATLSTQYLGIAMSHRPWGSNVHLRRALNYAVDREFLCERVLGGESAPAKGVLPPETPGPFDVALRQPQGHEQRRMAQGRPEGTRMGGGDPALPGYSYDLGRARSELREAGYGPGLEPVEHLPEMTLYFNSRPPGAEVAQALQADFQRIGIRVQLRALDLAALLEATNQDEPDLFRLTWAADFPDAESFLRIFHSSLAGSAGNRARYSNARVDDLLDRSRRELQPEKRFALLREAESIIVADAPWVFLSHGQTHLLVKPYVRGLELTPMDVGTSVNQVDFHEVSFQP